MINSQFENLLLISTGVSLFIDSTIASLTPAQPISKHSLVLSPSDNILTLFADNIQTGEIRSGIRLARNTTRN